MVFVTVSLGGMALAGPVMRWPRTAAPGVLLLPAIAAALIASLTLQDHPFASNGWAA